MSLNWNVEQIENYESVCWVGEGDDRHMNPVTHALIFATLSVGLGSITDSNAAEFYARLNIVEKLQGPFVVMGGEGVSITPQEVKAHIGLTCNVGNETRAQWARRLFVGRSKGYSDVSITSDNVRIYNRVTQEVAA